MLIQLIAFFQIKLKEPRAQLYDCSKKFGSTSRKPFHHYQSHRDHYGIRLVGPAL